VDIQPVAVQIAKLRFFISLVVDQKVDIKATNLGVRPLPNLETRLVAADTLIPLTLQLKQADIFDNDSDASRNLETLRNELKRIRHEHFNARDPGRKRHWRDEDQRVREAMRDLLRKTGIPSDTAKAMSAWDPYDQNTFASFFDPDWMFGLKPEEKQTATLLDNFALVNEASGQMELTTASTKTSEAGFDIVLGNPPYVSSERFARTTQQECWKSIYRCYASRIDIYCLFYERSLNLLGRGGVLTFISSNKFLRAGYGKNFRPLIAASTTIDRIVDFWELPVFKAATDTAVVLLRREQPRPDSTFIGANIKSAEEIEHLQDAVRTRGIRLAQADLQNEGWTFEKRPVLDLLQRIKNAGKPLHEVTKEQFFRGIITGLNEAYVISSEKRLELINEDSRSSELIKPWLQGREIKRWFGAPSGLYVIVVRYGFHDQLAEYPAILKHLKTHSSKLKQRGQCQSSRNGDSTGQHHWLELDNNPSEEYLKLFDGTKIVFNETSKELHAFVDREGLYINKTGFVLVADNPDYVLAILMSRMLDWLYRMEFPNWGDPWKGGRIQFRGDRMANVPIASANDKQQRIIAELANALAFLSRYFVNNPADQSTRDPLMLAYFEQIMNGLVYELYFPEEVHAAGLHLFDVVEQSVGQAFLPAIPPKDADTNVCTTFLPRLRTLFETLYDGTHPLRIALDKLQTLDTVRIIEGKAT